MARKGKSGKGSLAVASAAAAPRGNCRKPTLDMIVQRKIYDSLSKMTPTQLDVMVNSYNRTCRQQLAYDIERHINGTQHQSFGMLYYNQLKNQFRLQEDPYKLLGPLPDPQPIAAALETACKAALRNHPDRSQLTAWMSSATLPNRSEVRGLYRMLLCLKCRCAKQLPACLAAVRFIARLDLRRHYPDDTALMTEWIDDTLSATLQASRANKKRKVSDATFVDLHRASLGLLMNEADLAKVRATSGSFSSLSEELNRLITSSRVGELLFVGSVQSLLVEAVSLAIDESVDRTFSAKREVTETALVEGIRRATSSVEALESIEHLPASRMVGVTYRGLTLKMSVHSWQHEIVLKHHARVRAIGVDTQKLAMVFGETALVATDYKPVHAGTVAADLLVAPQECRRLLEQLLADAGANSADTVRQAARTAPKTLAIVDEHYGVELAILSMLTEAGSSSRIMGMLLQCCPTALSPGSPSSILAKLAQLENSELYKLSARGDQQKVHVAMQMLRALGEGRRPCVEGSLTDPCLKPFVESWAWFFSYCEVKPAKKGEEKIYHRGHRAIPFIINAARKQVETSTSKLEDVAQLATMDFLIPEQFRSEAKELVTAVQEQCLSKVKGLKNA